MKNVLNFGCSALAATLLFAGGAVYAADSPKLVAPIYKGAVPALPADGVKNVPAHTGVGVFGGIKALDCNPHAGLTADGPWCFLTRDPIDKVKAFYEKAIGPMQPINGKWGLGGGLRTQGYAVYAERAWTEFDTDSGRSAGHVYTGISLHALPPPPVRGKEAKTTDDSWEGQEVFKFYAQTRHFGAFNEGVDWFGDPSKRKPAELHALYKKHGRLESALFQRKGPKSEPVDETLRARYSKKQGELMKGAQSGMVPSQAQIAQMQAAAQRPMPAAQSATPENAEFNAFMKKNPKVAKRYAELTQKTITLMQQGKFDEADAADEELEKLVQSHPELAALERRSQGRSAAAGAAQQAQENQAMGAMNNKMDQANWGTWLDYIKAAEKEAYYTLIVIDRAFLTGKEKDYSRDRTLIAKETAGSIPHPQVFGFTYGASAQQPAQAGGSSPVTQPSAPPEQPKRPQDEVKDAAKKGWKALKKLF